MKTVFSEWVYMKLVQAHLFHKSVDYLTDGPLETKTTFSFTVREIKAPKVKLLPQELEEH